MGQATSSVVRLPTAPRRMVRQPCNKWSRAVRKKLREEQQWPGEYIHPQRRAALRKAQTLVGIERTPGLVLALAIFAELGDDTQSRVIGRMAKEGACKEVRQAIELAQTVGDTVGEQLDLMWAIDRLRSGDS